MTTRTGSTQPEPRLSRESVARAGLALVDERGLTGFSLRSVAARLGVTPMALYRYVPDRESLVGEMCGLVVAGIDLPPDDLPWQDWVREFAHRYRAAVHRHPALAPWLGTRVESNHRLEFGALDRLLAALARGGFTGPALVEAFDVVVGGVVGFVTTELASPPADPAGWERAHAEHLAAVDPDRQPVLARHLPDLGSSFVLRSRHGAAAPMDAAFAAFADVLVRGLAARREHPERNEQC